MYIILIGLTVHAIVLFWYFIIYVPIDLMQPDLPIVHSIVIVPLCVVGVLVVVGVTAVVLVQHPVLSYIVIAITLFHCYYCIVIPYL